MNRRAFLELVAAAPLVAALKPWRPTYTFTVTRYGDDFGTETWRFELPFELPSARYQLVRVRWTDSVTPRLIVNGAEYAPLVPVGFLNAARQS